MEGFLAAVGSVWDGVGPMFQEFGGWLSVAALVVWRLMVRAWRWWTRPAPLSPEGQWLLDMLSDPSKCDWREGYVSRLLPDSRWLVCYMDPDEAECRICNTQNWFDRAEPSTPLLQLLPVHERRRIHNVAWSTYHALDAQTKERHKQDGLNHLRDAMQRLGPKDMVADRPFTVVHAGTNDSADWVAEDTPEIDLDVLADKVAQRIQPLVAAADAQQPAAEPAKERGVSKWMHPPVGVVVEAQREPGGDWFRVKWDGVQWERVETGSILTRQGQNITPPNEQAYPPSDVSLPANCRCTTDPELAPSVVTVASTSPKTINGKPYPPVGQLVEVLTNMGWRTASWRGTTWEDAIHRCAILTPLDWRML